MDEIKFIKTNFEEIIRGFQTCSCTVKVDELGYTVVADYFIEVRHPVE